MTFKDIQLDIKAVQERDPATHYALEVLLLYQGVHVLIWRRFAHWFYKHRIFFVARLISQIARFFTLVRIHPDAQLDHDILIDHGCGVVIGETTVAGDNYTIYQGVTPDDMGTKKGKRHPTLGNNVMVGAGTKILGVFEVGDNCSIAANAVLLKPLEDNVTAVGIPAHPIKKDGVTIPKVEKNLTLGEYETMRRRMEQMEKKIEFLKGTLKDAQARAWLTVRSGKITYPGGDTRRMKQEAPHVNIERSVTRQFCREIWRPSAKGLQDYKMIKDGDRVTVCISDGKDSMLLAKYLQQLKRQNQTDSESEFIVMDPGYNPDNRKLVEDNVALMNIPVRIFDPDIFGIVMDMEQSSCYLYTRVRREYLYAHARELGCNKITLRYHFDDVIETIPMGILCGDRINTMMPKLYNTNFRGMELIHPLCYVKEEDILTWKDYNDLHFLQCACRFTEQIAKEQAAGGTAGETSDIVRTSKRQEMKGLIRSLRKTNPFVGANIMKSMGDINLDACLGYVKDRVRRRFMDEYGEGQKKNINHLLSAQIFLKDYKKWQVFFMELIKKQVHVSLWKDSVTTRITLNDGLIVPDTLDGMKQIMLGTDEMRIETVKSQSDKMAVKGKLEFQVLYREGSDGLQTLDDSTPFEEMISAQSLEKKDYVELNWVLEGLDTDVINSGKLGVQAIITLQVRVETLRDMEVAADVNIEGNSRPAGANMSDMDKAEKVQVETLKRTANAAAIAVRREDTYRIKGELSLTGDKPSIGRLLWREMELRDVTVEPLDGRFHLDGELSVFVVYGAGDEDIPVQWLEETIPFSGDMEMNDVREDQIPMMTVCLTHRNIEAKPDYDEEMREMDVDAVLGLDIKLYEEEVMELLSDMYFNSREIELNRSDACFDQILTRNVCKSKVTKRLSLPQAERILQICHNEETTRLDDAEIGDDCLEIDGVLKVTLPYLTSSDTSSVQSSMEQVPFRYAAGTRGIREDSVYQLDAGLEQLSAVMMDRDVVEVKAVIALDFLVLQPVCEPVITGTAIHPTDLQKLQELPGVVGYIVQPEDSLWETAKEFHTTVGNIVSTNELTDDQVKQGQRLLLMKEIAQGL